MENVARYEVLILAAPEITQDETRALEKQLENIIQSYKGTIISFERWGKYKLAYPVRKNEYGVYFLDRFQMIKNEKLIDEIKILLSVKFETIIMRSVITSLDKLTSLEYQRPASLEEAPLGAESTNKERRSHGYEAHSLDADQGMQNDDMGNE